MSSTEDISIMRNNGVIREKNPTKPINADNEVMAKKKMLAHRIS